MPNGDLRDVRAAGAVVTRKGAAEWEVLLVHRPKYDDWSFPKGKLDPGEHEVTAAVREVAEETGLDVRLGPPLAPQRYRMASGRWKHGATTGPAGWWASDDVSGYRPNDEIDAVEWVPWRRRDDAADLPLRPRHPRRGVAAASQDPRARRAPARQGALARGLAQGRPAAAAAAARRARRRSGWCRCSRPST